MKLKFDNGQSELVKSLKARREENRIKINENKVVLNRTDRNEMK
jgi:hypothetical protein